MQYIRDNSIGTPADLQIDFTNRMSQWLASKNYRMMGWNEITVMISHNWQSVEDKSTRQRLAPGTIVHFWAGDAALVKKTIEAGYDVVNSSLEFTYLDLLDQRYIPLEKAYSFNPVPDGLTDEQKKKVLGLGCQMWSEWVPDTQNMNGKVYPRIAAYAETGWTLPDKKDYSRFLKALDYFLTVWKQQGIEFK
jgi:N-acetyl-beta-hexosaminidase